MSVDFSQFFNGPIRESLIAQVSGYLDISRPQATTAYDKAVALVIGAMARQAAKPEGAQTLTDRINDSQTQASLTSSALSPTVLTNDQFSQIVTLGEREQATILGAQQEAVSAHLEVATGLDRPMVVSLLSIVVPFVLSYLKNNITTEIAPAPDLPTLLATQAPHVAPQLDAPALAALGANDLQELFGAEALAAGDAGATSPSSGKESGVARGPMTNDKTTNGWFKWVLTLAVVLAGAAWIKSCTQSEIEQTDNAKPADQQQSATETPATDEPSNEPAGSAASTAAETSAGAAADSDAPAEPATDFPAPASDPSAETPDSSDSAEQTQADSAQNDSAPSELTEGESTQSESTQGEASQGEASQGESAQDESAQDESAQDESAQDESASTAVAPATTGSSDSVATSDGQATTAQSPDEQDATDSVEKAATEAQEARPNPGAETATEAPTYGQASDSMEPESAASSAGTGGDAPNAGGMSPDASSSAEEETTDTSASTIEADGADNGAGEQQQEPAISEDTSTTPAAAEPAEQPASADDSGASGNTPNFAASTNSAQGQSAGSDPAEKEADTQVDTQSEAQSDTQSDTQSEAQSDTQSDTQSDVQSDVQSDTQGDPQSETQQGTQDDRAEATGDVDTHTQPSNSTQPLVDTTTSEDGGQVDSAISDSTQTDAATVTGDAPDPSATATDSVADGAHAAATSAAQIRLERDGDTFRIEGAVPDEAERNRIVSAAKSVDGHSEIDDKLTIDSAVRASTIDDYPGLFSLLRGYRNVNVSLDKDVLTLTGQVSSNEEKESLATRAQTLGGRDIQVSDQTEVAASDASAVPDSAAAAATAPQVRFALGSAQVDSRFHQALDQYAQHLKNSGKSVRLTGFADQSGNEPANNALSKRRAESVKAYLILRGVQAQRIEAEGQGTHAPIADNTTEAGRAQNRRVEFHEQ